MKYVAPQRGLRSFTCPHCGVLAQQSVYSNPATLHMPGNYNSSEPIATAICTNCQEFTLWIGQTLVYPDRADAPVPDPDMPADVLADYEEAAGIASKSPKAAAALLRLAIQKLCVHLGGAGKNINDDIALLVKNGLPGMVQQSLDVVRVVGNNAVHPGQIDVDDPQVVAGLFGLVNLIVEAMISTPKRVSALYSTLPSGALERIAKRDADASS